MKRKEIETPRLRLAALRPSDKDALTGILADGGVSKTYMVPELRSEEEKTALFERLRELSGSDRFFYGIFREDRLIGLIHEVAREDDEVELGYVISPAEQGRGYASEALKAAISELFLQGVPVVKAAAFAENAASMRVMEKCGMERTGQTETVEYRGSDHICIYYAVANVADVNGEPYRVLRLLGHGKGGYSYLAERGGRKVVLKQIHHEPCDYYTFGNKIEAELYDFGRLKAAGIRIPELLAADREAERIVKEYIEGDTVAELIQAGAPGQDDPALRLSGQDRSAPGRSARDYIPQVREMAALARAAGLNIDYYPTNFVAQADTDLLYYIDYECNTYMDEWSFENWGQKYWEEQ